MDNVFTTNNKEETQKIAQDLGKKIKEQVTKDSESVVLLLYGDLGAGKTTFMQGFAKGLGIEQSITSPTFIIMRTYDIDTGIFYHVDLYRITNASEIDGIGLKEGLVTKGNIIAIEWAEKLENNIPEKRIEIHLEHLQGDKRKIEAIYL